MNPHRLQLRARRTFQSSSAPPGRRLRRGRRWALAVLGGISLLAGGPARAQTIVSLEFDDGTQSQYQVRQMLLDRGLRATFYVNSGRIGNRGYLSLAQLHDLQGDGNEIGGHTLDHLDLTTLSAAEAERQVCEDRAALQSSGFDVRNFAYPFGAYEASVQSIVLACGYDSARTVGGIGCSGCPAAESLPPADPFATRTRDSVKSATSLATLQNYVTAAETSGGGWVQLVFHHICDGCSTYSVSPSTLSAFLDWLVPRSASGTVVRTVREALGGPSGPDTTPPVTSIACSPRGCAEWSNGPTSVTLRAVDWGSGVAEIRYTIDGSEPTETTGIVCPESPCSFVVSTTTLVQYRAWDLAGNVEPTKSQLIRIDTAPPAVSITSPADGASFRAGAHITLTAAASDNVGIAEVRFYDEGSGLIGTDASAPYEVVWKTNRGRTPRGQHRLYAEATDLAGNTTQSSPVTVNLQ